MAIVIRTAYNNGDWRGPCSRPGEDRLCWICFEDILEVDPPDVDDDVCSGDCWERRICADYKWGCTPKGRKYGSNAYPGATVYLVFKQPDGSYTIWGRTKVRSVDTEVMTSPHDYEDGFAFVHFEPFDPLPRDKWVPGLSDVQLVDARWLQGRHRYIGSNQERYLDQLIDGQVTPQRSTPVAPPTPVARSGQVTLETAIANSIYKRLEEVASSEGRTVDELVRQAIAEFLRNR